MFCQLLLVNLFIATLSDTYSQTSDCQKEWLRQWAAQILCVEQMMSVAERKEVLEKYTQIIEGKRVIMIRWKQSVTYWIQSFLFVLWWSIQFIYLSYKIGWWTTRVSERSGKLQRQNVRGLQKQERSQWRRDEINDFF